MRVIVTRLAIAAFSTLPPSPLVTEPEWRVAYKELSESELGGESADANANARGDNLMRWEGQRFENFELLATNYLVTTLRNSFRESMNNEMFLPKATLSWQIEAHPRWCHFVMDRHDIVIQTLNTLLFAFLLKFMTHVG